MLVVAVLASAPSPAAEPVKLASPGYTAVNVDDKLATFLADHFAQQLSVQGFRVLTATEIGALIGLERQKQLLGCSDSSTSCMAELANALGVDGLIIGSIARFDSTYQVNLKIVSASNAEPLAVFSGQVEGDKALLGTLNQAAKEMAPQIYTRLGRTPAPVTAPEQTAGNDSNDSNAVRATVNDNSGEKHWPTVPTVVGGVLLGLGAASWVASNPQSDSIRNAQSLPEAVARRELNKSLTVGGEVSMIAGAAVLAGTAVYYFAFEKPAPLQPQVMITPTGASIGLAGVLP